MNTGVPSSVFVDGERIAGSVFKAMLEEDLGFRSANPGLYGSMSPICTECA